jgi:cell division protein FtsQ
MWDRPDLLTAAANLLYGLAIVSILYMVLLVAIHLPVFPVREVRVLGDVSRVTRDQIESVVRNELKGNFFTISLDGARGAFEKLPWVRRVSVRRHWPDRLEVALEEHVALARWGDEGLVNTYGEVFEAASDARLPVFAGPKEASHEIADKYARFERSLAPVGKQVAEVSLSARRAWRLRLADGVTIELGREQVEARLEKFAGAFASSVALMREPPAVVDLRYPNGFAVRVRELKWTGHNRA